MPGGVFTETVFFIQMRIDRDGPAGAVIFHAVDSTKRNFNEKGGKT